MKLGVSEAARERPSAPALVIGAEHLTFAALADLTARARRWLGSQGLGAGSRLALVGRSDRATIALILAAVDAGVVPVLMHPRWTDTEVRAALETVSVDAIAPSESAWLAESGDLAAPITRDPEAPLAILFTSGTTGAPRGVVLSRRAFAASAAANEENLGWSPDDRWLLALPIAHIGGLSILTRCLMARATVVLPPELEQSGKLTLEATVTSVERDAVTLLSLVPTQLARLLDAQWMPPPRLRAILVGGAPASPSLLRRAADRGWPLLTTYGLTEACSQVATQQLGTVNRGELGAGRPVRGVEIRVREGRIQLRGDMLLTGTLPETECFDADGWFDTGDHGQLDADGNLHVLGRGRDLIVSGGENVHPAEVERCLAEQDGVIDACAFGVPDEEWGQAVAVAIVARPDLELRTLTRLVSRRLAPFKRPRLVAVLEELPVTRAGKLDRDATARLATPALGPLPDA